MTTYYLQRQAIGRPGSVGTAAPIPEAMLARLAVETCGGGYTAESTRQAMVAHDRMLAGAWSYQHPRTHAAYAIAVCQDATKG